MIPKLSLSSVFSGGYRSTPKVVKIKDGENWMAIRSLALIADFGKSTSNEIFNVFSTDEEGLRQLQWFDIDCGDCQKQDKCLDFQDQKSCASLCQNSTQ